MLPRQYNHNPPLPKRDKARNQNNQTPPLTRGSKHNSQPLPKREQPNKNKGLQQVIQKDHKHNLFSHK